MRIFIFGAYGRLGTCLSSYLKKTGHQVIRQGRNNDAELSFDPLERNNILQHLTNCRPDIIINLVGQTSLSANENDPALAYRINAGIPENISFYINSIETNIRPKFIQISTDHMYDSTEPSVEDDACPKNVYAMTKMLGEYSALKGSAIVLRTNYIGASSNQLKPSFTDWAVNSLRERTQIRAFKDIWLNALHLSTLCSMIGRTVTLPGNGVYNLGCKGRYNKADIIIYLANQLNISSDKLEICNADFFDGVNRPKSMYMNVSKFERDFLVTLPHFSYEFQKTANDYLN